MQTLGKVLCTCGQVLGHVVQNLGAVVAARRRPTAERGPGGLDGIAQVFAVAVANFANDLAAWAINKTRVARIGPRLFAADVHLGRAVDRRTRLVGEHWGVLGRSLARTDHWQPTTANWSTAHVFVQPLAPAFATE